MKLLSFYKISLAVSLVLIGCVNKNDGSFRWIDNSIMISDQEAIKEKQQLLLNARTSSDLNGKISHGVVFDGTTISVSVNTDTGLRIVKIQVERILFGKLENQDIVTIYTPSIEKGGVNFLVNKKYRIFAIYLRNAYRTWASSGTVEIDTTEHYYNSSEH